MIKTWLIKTKKTCQLWASLNYRSFSISKDPLDLHPEARKTVTDKPHSMLFEEGNKTRGEFMTEEQMYTYKEKNFIDRVRVHVYGGGGGAGSVAHLKDHRGLKGKASGGSGGQGGSVYIRSAMEEKDLSYIKSKVR